jgi:hypothetical protein
MVSGMSSAHGICHQQQGCAREHSSIKIAVCGNLMRKHLRNGVMIESKLAIMVEIFAML